MGWLDIFSRKDPGACGHCGKQDCPTTTTPTPTAMLGPPVDLTADIRNNVLLVAGYLWTPAVSFSGHEHVVLSEQRPSLVHGHCGIIGFECGATGRQWAIPRDKFVTLYGEASLPRDSYTLVPALLKIDVPAWSQSNR